MKDMTLSELSQVFDVSRRAVQGYEKAGLITASGKNERGHLLYDEASQQRIQQIKRFQRMGFTIREITSLLDAPSEIVKPILEQQLQKLEKEKEDIELLIQTMNVFVKKL